MRTLVAAIAVLALAGCGGDLCAKEQECAQKSGATFSITECRQNASIQREQAQSRNCAAQYDALTACAVGLSCGSTAADLTTNCGARVNDYARCLGL
jgi:hypothetical protein